MKYLIIVVTLLINSGCGTPKKESPEPKIVVDNEWKMEHPQVIKQKYESPHPYAGAKKKGLTVWSQTIKYTEDENISFIAVHFDKIELVASDQLIVRSPDNSSRYEYGRDIRRNQLWSGRIFGNEVIIEIISNYGFGDYGYLIEEIIVGTSVESIEATTDSFSTIDFAKMLNDDLSKNEIIANKTNLYGTWQMLSIGDRILHKYESASTRFSFYETENPSYNMGNMGVGCSIGCNSLGSSVRVEKNIMKFLGLSMTEKYCPIMMEVEEEMTINYYKIHNFKLVNGLLFLLDEEDKIVFALKPWKPAIEGTWEIFSVGRNKRKVNENELATIKFDFISREKGILKYGIEASVGCITIDAKLKLRRFEFTDVESTLDNCDRLSELEKVLKENLLKTSNYRIGGRSMYFTSKDGHCTFRFQKKIIDSK